MVGSDTPVATPSQARASLVVGGDGQVGARLRARLGDGCVATSRRSRADARAFDLARPADGLVAIERELAAGRVAAVYCVAAMTDVEACEGDADAAHAVNCVGPGLLARAAARADVPFVYFSTDYVFDGAAGPYGEDDPVAPLSVYGRSKVAGEEAVRDAHPHALVVRTNVVYGPDAREKNFVYAVRRVLGSGATMRTPVDQYSSPTYNDDLAAATIALVDAGASGVYHVGGPETMHRTAFARRAAVALGLDPELVLAVPTAELGQRASRPLRSGLRIEKLRRTLPNVRMRTVEEAIPAWIRETTAARA